MVGVVVIDLRLQPVEGLTDIGLLEAQPETFTLELAAIHAPSGVAGEAVATACGQLDQGVRIRHPAERDIGVPLVIARRHGIAIAVRVVVSLRAVGHQPRVTLCATHGGIQVAVETTVGAG